MFRYVEQRCVELRRAHIAKTVEMLGEADQQAVIKGLLAIVRGAAADSSAMQELKKAVLLNRRGSH